MPNIHPIFVHFPIALLTVYALCEFVHLKKLRHSKTWLMVKAVLLWVGFAGSLVALQTGEWAEDLTARTPLIKMHSQWAEATAWIFGALAVVYALVVLERYCSAKICSWIGDRGEKVFMKLARVAESIHGSFLTPLLALIGLAVLTVTGSLGGAIVYGPEIDPVAHFIYTLLFPGA
jgi:uncharacterized membrane protein